MKNIGYDFTRNLDSTVGYCEKQSHNRMINSHLA